jgi:hypothetical protein
LIPYFLCETLRDVSHVLRLFWLLLLVALLALAALPLRYGRCRRPTKSTACVRAGQAAFDVDGNQGRSSRVTSCASHARSVGELGISALAESQTSNRARSAISGSRSRDEWAYAEIEQTAHRESACNSRVT